MPRPSLSLASLTFRAGPNPAAAALTVAVPTVVVLVGPNNSGKSLSLREIENSIWNPGHPLKVFAHVEVTYPSTGDEAVSLLEEFKAPPPQGQIQAEDHLWVGLPTFRSDNPVLHQQLSISALRRAAEQRQENELRSHLGRLYTVRLDGRTRFALSDPKPTGDLQGHPQNHLWALFQRDEARERVRRLTEEAFGVHFVVDPTAMTQFRVRMSDRAPGSKAEEQALDTEARAFHRAAPLIGELSDGVQAFTGLVSAVLSLPHRIILIDEPEAFLHPPLARRLGRNLTALATERGASLVVATHSAEFLMGCIEETAAVVIVRLTYERPVATARAITPGDLRQLMLDPLLKSTQALRGVFHRGVVVTEAEADRAFYDEINGRMQQEGEGLRDTLFLNAQNWQTIPRLVTPLRRLGIPGVAIIDLDAIAEGGPWPSLYAAFAIDAGAIAVIEELRNRAEGYLRAAPTSDGRKAYKIEGLAALRTAERLEVERLIQQLGTYGVFVVPVGELEGWLAGLGVARDPKRDWLSRMFSRLGSDPALGYVRPSTDDVWKFVREIAAWVENPNRLGMPVV